MTNIFKNAFKITNYNIILTIPLILFVKILDLYSLYSRYHVDSIPKVVIASVTVLFMFAVFCSGWFSMIKGAIDLSKQVFVLDADRAKATLNLFKKFPEGVGKFFLSFCGVYIIFFVIQFLTTPLVINLGVRIIGGLDASSLENLQQITMNSSSQGMATVVDNLTPEQIIFFGKWSLLFMVITSIITYLLMLWVPEIINKTRNPFVALFESLTKLFKHFFSSFRLFLALWFMGFFLMFISTFAVLNPISYLIMNIVLFYFSVYFIVLVFLYYDKKFVVVDNE